MGFKSPQAAYYSLSVSNYGHVDMGALQASGVVSAAATFTGKDAYQKDQTAKTNLTITVVGKAVQVGQTLNIAGTTSYNGVYKIIKVIDATHVVIDVTFVADESGTWNSLGAKGPFAGFIPMTTIDAGDITSITFLDESLQIGDPTKMGYIVGVFYPFAGIIDEIVLTLGDLRLLRYSSRSPQ